jgi:replication factor C small subunit
MKINITEKNIELWVEKYRPKLIKNLILPKEVKISLEEYVKKGDMSHMLFYGDQGIGKTSAALTLANEFDASFLLINGSLETGIDTVRDKIVKYLSTGSLKNKPWKIVIIDECDGLSAKSQKSLKATIEKFKFTGRFIFTTNHIEDIDGPLLSRLNDFNFEIQKEEKEELKNKMTFICKEILKLERIEYDEVTINEIIDIYFPDMRKTINVLQNSSVTKKLIYDKNNYITTIDKIIDSMKEKKWKKIRESVLHIINHGKAINEFYSKMEEKIKEESYNDYIVMLNEYQVKHKHSLNKEINFLALCIELTRTIKFK